MAVHDATSQRLFVEAGLKPGHAITCTADQANYLKNVLRMRTGETVLVFNGRHGEWRTTLTESGKRGVTLVVETQTRAQSQGPDIDYVFAPLKRARLDYMVQKATELGVARLRPVLTRYTVAERVNGERMRANAIEAAEQCGILHVPEMFEPIKLTALLDAWDPARRLLYCDESAAIANPVTTLSAIATGPLAVLIGPEGGFSPEERERLVAQPYVVALSLGPRVMRADTAAVAALALVNAVLGDWRA
jgi:16S rRNA (uracil1498-N3)-methyltransferase